MHDMLIMLAKVIPHLPESVQVQIHELVGDLINEWYKEEK